MSSEYNEARSAFADGELSDADLERLLSRPGLRRDLQQSQRHYLAIGQALRNEPIAPPDGALADAVSSALADEPTVLAPRPPSTTGHTPAVRHWAPFAAAASLAVAAWVGFQFAAPPDEPGLVASVPIQDQPRVAASVTSAAPQLPGRLRVLLLNHNESIPSALVNRAPAHATVVSMPSSAHAAQ